ncbi:hypothetical protein [Psychrobacillus sp.]|nr:hypothetical protein [Psychrobacillus sp.]
MTEKYFKPITSRESELEIPNIYELDEVGRYENYDEEDAIDFYYH